MTAPDLTKTQTAIYVRRALVRHWIDLERLSIRPVRDAIIVSGEIRLHRPSSATNGVAGLLHILEDELRRLHGVRRVRFELDNWTKDDAGGWIPRHPV